MSCNALQMTRVAMMVTLLAVAGLPAAAQVEVKTLSDGSRVIHNEGRVPQGRSGARLLAVPDGRLRALIHLYARQFGLEPRLVQAVVQVESGYDAAITSRKGAMGLMQLMPGTAQLLGVRDAYDAEQNIHGGTRYLREQLDRFSRLDLALAAYNAGPGAVLHYGGIPPFRETQNYVRKILSMVRDTPPPSMVEMARDEARRRRAVEASKAAATAREQGQKVYMTRDENNAIVFTTSPPR